MEITNDDLTFEIKPEDELLLVNDISQRYDLSLIHISEPTRH